MYISVALHTPCVQRVSVIPLENDKLGWWNQQLRLNWLRYLKFLFVTGINNNRENMSKEKVSDCLTLSNRLQSLGHTWNRNTSKFSIFWIFQALWQAVLHIEMLGDWISVTFSPLFWKQVKIECFVLFCVKKGDDEYDEHLMNKNWGSKLIETTDKVIQCVHDKQWYYRTQN